MDFLTFKDFISIPVLIGFYYMGAVVMPLSMWFFTFWLIKKFSLLGEIHQKGKTAVWSLMSTKQKLLFSSFFIAVFMFMELFWRLFFEYLIAFMQMRDALMR